MDKYPQLQAIHEFYSSFYDKDWERYVGVFHYAMLQENFLVVKEKTLSDRFVYTKNQKNELFITYSKNNNNLASKLYNEGDFFVVDIQEDNRSLPWIRINLGDHLNKSNKFVRLPILINFLKTKTNSISNDAPSLGRQRSPKKEIVPQASALPWSIGEQFDVLHVNVDNEDLPDEQMWDPSLRTPTLK